ncbi:hypothetical protein [Sphingobacterium sp. UBA6645]|uniref:hypothetical protein n=1 Tax=Sphingobacterium sp. UBA6645 TaxID=1947511 RepID=UPI0025FAF2DD|nr:hypothetical protein [Sphingobacterium sp. UBA6645]
MRKQKASVVEGSKIQTGQCKVNVGQKIFKTIERAETRTVRIDYRTEIQVDASDERSSEQIRIDYLAKVAS